MTNTHACETHTSENKGKPKQNERHTHTHAQRSTKAESSKQITLKFQQFAIN